MKEGSRVILRKALDSAQKNYLTSIGIVIPDPNKVYRISTIWPNFFIGNNGITLQEIPPLPAGDCIYNEILWREVDEISNYTISSLFEELVEEEVCVA